MSEVEIVPGRPAAGGAQTLEYVPWETLREIYLGRFGPLLAVEEEVDFGEWEPQAGDLLLQDDEEEEDDGSDPPDGWEDEDADDHEEEVETPEEAAARFRADLALQSACESSVLLHYELTFAHLTEEEPRVVVASFGAVSHAGHEVFLESAVPFCGFNGVISRIAREHAPLSPGMVVEVEIPYTPFTAVLLAPEGSGSIPLGEAGGARRFALRLVPLTAAEAKLGAESVERLVAALGAAGALGAVDPLRDCVVAPRKTQGYWALMRSSLLALTRHRLKRRLVRHDRLATLDAPAMILENERQLIAIARLLLRHIESKPVDPASPAEQWAAMFRRYEVARDEIYRGAQGFFAKGVVPAGLRRACAIVVVATLQTHPVAERVLEWAGNGSPGEGFDAGEAVLRLVGLVAPLVPWVDPAALVAGGRMGHAVAREACGVADGFVAPHVLWEHVMAGMCMELVNDASEAEQDAMLDAFQAGVTIANHVLVREDARPPLVRLEAASREIVRRMVLAWLESEGFPVDEPAGEGAWPAPEAPERFRGKKPCVYH